VEEGALPRVLFQTSVVHQRKHGHRTPTARSEFLGSIQVVCYINLLLQEEFGVETPENVFKK